MKHKAMCSAPFGGLVAPAFMARVLAAVVLAAACTPAHAASLVRFSGRLDGLVTDVSGKPQPGAIVVLLNQQNRFLQKSATDAFGSFSFGDLLPDLYSIQVSFASFVPALKERIQIRSGMRSLVEVNLSRVFSSVQLVATTPVPDGLMSESWKWAVRANDAARPVLRVLPAQTSAPQASDNASADSGAPRSMFNDSRGLVKISASDGASTAGETEADLGTEFAFTTSVYGANHLQVAGDLAYGTGSLMPSGAFRTTYSRELSDGFSSPEAAVTMRQFYVPLRMGQSFAGGAAANDGSLPVLRTVGVSFGDKTQLNDSLTMEYGFELDSVSFLNHLNYFSPYTRLTRALPHGAADFTWTSGNPRPELGMSATGPNADLQRDLASLGVIPGVTLTDGHSHVERGENYELGISQRFGSREYRVSAYQESVSNTVLMIASPAAGLFAGDLLPTLFSNSASFDMGRFENFGYTASATQDLGDNYKVALIYGSVGMLSAPAGEIFGETSDDLRRALAVSHRPAVTVQISGTYKRTGTRFKTSYQWTSYQSATPGPSFSTQSTRPEPGLNVTVRQPMPLIPRMPWRMEATAELRNLLAQGYLPVSTPAGDQVLVVNVPRSIRGALAFVF